MKAFHFCQVVCLSLLALLPLERASASEPTDRLLTLVGSDVGLCIEVSNARERLPAFLKSPFFKRLKESSIYNQWLESQDFQKLSRAREHIQRLVNKPFEEFSRELFGTAVVLALYPEASGKPVGVLLVEAESEDVLDAAVSAWNRASKQEPTKLEHAGHSFFRRRKPAEPNRDAETLYYAKLGPVFALSDNVGMIQRVIDRHAPQRENARDSKLIGGESLFESVSYKRSRQSLSPKSVVSLYVNPRAWDKRVDAQASDSKLGQMFADAWRRCESLIVGVRLEPAIAVELIAHYDGADPPSRWSRFLNRTKGGPEFLEKVPQRALAAVVGRHDLAGLTELLIEQTPQPKQEQWKSFRQVSRGLLLGLDLFDDVLPRFGPNWVMYVVPRHKQSGNAPPIDGLLAIELPADGPQKAEDGKAAIRPALDNGLNTGLNLLAAIYNQKSPEELAVVKSKRRDSVLIRWIEGFEPIQPAFALTPRYLVFSSSPSLIDEFLTIEAGQSLAMAPEYRRWQDSYFPTENQLFFVNVERVRNFVSANRQYFVRQATREKAVSVEEAGNRLDRFDDLLKLFDGAFVAARIDDDRVRLVIGGGARQPVRSTGISK